MPSLKPEKKSGAKKMVWTDHLDMDSSVRGVYGKQEGAAKGFNSKKKGQRSYHPLLCFIAKNRECLHNRFRCGNAYSANGSVDFMKECFSKLPDRAWSISPCVRIGVAFDVDVEKMNGNCYMLSLRFFLKPLKQELNNKLSRTFSNIKQEQRCTFNT